MFAPAPACRGASGDPNTDRKEKYPNVDRSARVVGGILATIVGTKRAEIAALGSRAHALRAAAEEAAPVRAFAAALRRPEEVALIAEYKRRSPSAGSLGSNVAPARAARAYEMAGAAAVSVLTDAEYFGGSLEDLVAVRAAVGLPVLRKDFVLSEIQVYEARAAGADGVLLIVRILDDAALADLHAAATAVGLGVLVEVHDEAELERALRAGARIVGVNNRDLDTFTTDVGLSLRLAAQVPADVVLVAESGIRTGAEVDRLGAAGVDAILVGEALMRGADGVAAQLAGRSRAERAGPAGVR
jgi:indole-3-glycerol phosphate synthase